MYMATKNSKHGYECLPAHDDDANHHHNYRMSRNFLATVPWWLRLVLCVLLLETLHGGAFLIWYSGLLSKDPLSTETPALDGYFELQRYNSTKTFFNDNSYSEDSAFADDFWLHMQPPSAIISLPEAEISALGLPMSARTPDAPGEMVYQLDIFHSLHCLYKIRQRLLGNETHPKDGHSLHCLNYIWQSLKCNADIMLGSTDTLDDYGLKDTHTCRDYTAIEKWVERHLWKGFDDWASNPVNEVPVPEMLQDAVDQAI